MIFTFGIVTYNHENYILEHLESIKFLIEQYGRDIQFQVIVADDCSKDDTVKYVKLWLEENAKLFTNTTILVNNTNKGTCYNYTQIWEHIVGDYCKITAGDDVYSNFNLFSFQHQLNSNHIVSGLPLLLINNEISCHKKNLFYMAATDIIYRNIDYTDRLQNVNIANTPNLFITNEAFKNKEILEFVRNYSVIEDLPLHIKIAEIYKPLKFLQLDEVVVYYRRTMNSTYIIRFDTFNNDKNALYNYLILNEKNVIKRCLLKNRLFCFNSKNKIIGLLFNLNYYLYFFRLILNIFKIIQRYKKFSFDITIHQQHQQLIWKRASSLLDKYKQM